MAAPTLVACTGAKTAQFFAPTSKDPAEFASPDERSDLVTMTFGGDDIGFTPIVKQCTDLTRLSQALRTLVRNWVPIGVGAAPLPSDPGHTCPKDSIIRSRITALGENYPGSYRGGNDGDRAGGNIVLEGYPDIVEPAKFWSNRNQTIGSCFGIGTGDATLLRGWAGDLNATLAEAVKTFNAEPGSVR